MSPQCSRPDLQTALLNEARDAETLPLDLAQHLEECEACQTAAERLRRMVSVWEADQVDEEAMAAAAARFQARGVADHAGPRWFDVVPFASAGVAAGYLLLAATGAISLPWKSRPAMDASTQAASPQKTPTVGRNGVENGLPRVAPLFAATDESAKSVRARPHIETARGVAPLVDGLRLELKLGESARVALADGHASKVEGPCLVEFWSSPMEAGGWKLVRAESTASSKAVIEAPSGAAISPTPIDIPAIPSTAVEGATESAAPALEGAARPGAEVSTKNGRPSARETGAAAALKETVTTQAQDATVAGANVSSVKAWARAAAALREDDFAAADRAFDELGHSSDPATRDAARLARAQLWISRGREAAVRPVLEQLAQSGATALVRERAAEFLYR
jgi:hypothetical protein